MTCSQWQFLLATAEARDLAENVALRTHLAVCAACAQFAREMRALCRVTRSLPPLTPSPEFRARVRRRLDETQQATCLPF